MYEDKTFQDEETDLFQHKQNDAQVTHSYMTVESFQQLSYPVVSMKSTQSIIS